MKSVSLQCVPCNSLYRLKGTEYPKCLTNLSSAIWNFIAGQYDNMTFVGYDFETLRHREA